MNPTVGDFEGNTLKVLAYLKQARKLEADLVAFPELVLTGYPPEDLLLRPSFIEQNRAALDQVQKECLGITAIVGFVDVNDGNLFNAAAIICDGQRKGSYHKVFLPNYGVFDEERYFKRGNVCPVYTIRGIGVGVNICEDIWHADGPVPIQREAGAQIIININGSPYHFGKERLREQMLATRAQENELYIAYVNTIGGQDELVFDGASLVYEPTGRLLARAAQFQEELLVVDLDMSKSPQKHFFVNKSGIKSSNVHHVAGTPQKVHVSSQTAKLRPAVNPPQAKLMDPIEEVYQALLLGTRDYVRKNGFEKVLVSISGGIDSSLVCVIAADALGNENVLGVAMPSRFSSAGSLLDAKTLTDALNVPLWVLPIEAAHRAFEEVLAPHFHGTEPNVAEQNIQARIRGNLLMALSNKFGLLVLTTGNKSELAMGYATLYGDMAGGLAVIKDVPKTLVYELSRWRNNHGEPFNPIPNSILEKPPSAELKPDQRDDDDLPPYTALDPVLEAYVEHDHSYSDMVASGFDPAIAAQVVQAVDRNEYKRRQAPVGIKITPRNFGRDRRMPIVNRYPG